MKLTVRKRPDGVLHVYADGKLAGAAYVDFVPRFEALADERNPILIELGRDFRGWTIPGLCRDLEFDFTHQKQFGRMAVLGDRWWQKWGARACNVLFPGEMRFFEHHREADALAWLHQQPRTG